MSARKLLLLTAVVFALFAFIVFFERKMPTAAEREAKGDLHWDLPADRVVSIRLEHAGSVVELARDGENWRLTRPAPYPADSFAASDLARQLMQLKRVGGDSSEARPEDYGLVSPSARATIVWKDAGEGDKKSTRTIEFGVDIPGTDIAAARVSGQNRVLFIPSSVAAAAKKGASDYESKDVFGGSASDVARLDLERGRGHLLLAQRDGIWWMEQPVKDLADADAASRLAGDLTALRVIDFLAAEKDNLATWGLAPPLYRVMASDAKGKATTVEFGSTKSDGNSVYARREGQVFTVGSTIVEELAKEAEAFREPRLVRFDRAKASALEGTFGGEKVTLARGKDGGWSAAGKPALAASVDDLMTAILDLKSKAFLDEGDAKTLGARPVAASLRVVAADAEPWEIKFYGAPGEPGASVSRRPGAFRLAADPVAGLLAAFHKGASPAPPPTPVATARKIATP
ncbi:MAG TPA: DUF4340 domain-containing protein [Thermoanaerobaculia bacterium]|nr:DUF4340 domain-containing protein [Thermoanaerobaculia bacterium]